MEKKLAELIKEAKELINNTFTTKLSKQCNLKHPECNVFKCYCSLKKCKKSHITIALDYFYDEVFPRENPEVSKLEVEILRSLTKERLEDEKNSKTK